MGKQVELVCACGNHFEAFTSEKQSYIPCPQCGDTVMIPVATSIEAGPPPTTAGVQPDQSVPEEWLPGEVYLDRYEVQRVLGQGAMGKVYLVLHRGWNQQLAVKCPRRDVIAEFGGAACFEHECETWIRVGIYPHTVACYYARTLGGVPRVFAEYVDGRTLYEAIHSLKLYSGDPQENLRKILKIAVQTAWGLHHAHGKGIIHQDVKPGNIMMTKAGTAKVTDFGLARRTDLNMGAESAMASTSMNIIGMTPAYCSPEQSFRDHITIKTDIWSWGLTVFEMFSVDIVWPSGTAALDALERFVSSGRRRPEPPAMPQPIVDLLRQCFQSNPAMRPESLRHVANEVIRIYEELLGEPFPLSEPPEVEASGDALNNRAISLMDFGRKERAIKVWERALQEAPGHPQSAYNLALTRWRDATLTDDEAIRQTRASSESRPDEPLPIFLQLRLHLERGAIAEARLCLERLKQVAPDTPGIASIESALAGNSDSGRELLRTWVAHEGATTAIALDPVAGRLFTGGEDNRILMWDWPAGNPAGELVGHTNTIVALAWSGAQKRLASVSMERRIRVWDPTTGECLATHTTPSTRPRALVWLEDRGTLLLGESDGRLLEVSPETGAAAEPLARIVGGLRVLELSHAAGTLFCAGSGGEIFCLSLADFSSLDCFRPHSADITALCASPDGHWIASGDTTGIIAITESASGAHRATLQTKGHAILACAFAGNGRHLLTLCLGRRLQLWDVESTRCVWSQELPGGSMSTMLLGPDGAQACVALPENKLATVQVVANKRFEEAPLMISRSVDTDEVMLLEHELRSQLAVAATAYHEARYADTISKLRAIRARPEHSRRREVLQSWMHLYSKMRKTGLRSAWPAPEMAGHHGEVKALANSLQGTYLVSGGQDATIRVWDLSTAKAMRQFSGHAGSITALCMAQDQEHLVSGSEDATVKLWHVRTGRCERTLQHPGGAPEAMAMSPDGRLLVTAGWELHVWDLKLGTRVGVLAAHEGGCAAVLWSPSGRMLVSGGADGRIAFWDPLTGNLLGARQCPHGPVTALALSLDERTLVSSGGNPWDRRGKACVWDIAEGKPRRLIEEHAAPILRMAMTLDGRCLFTVSADGKMLAHDLETGATLRNDTLENAAPGALLLTNDASRMIWSGSDGVIRSLFFDWGLEPTGIQPTLGLPARKLFGLYAQGLIPWGNRLESTGGPGERASGWPLYRNANPLFEPRALKRFAYLAGCAGLGVYEPAAIESAAMQYTEALERERKEKR